MEGLDIPQRAVGVVPRHFPRRGLGAGQEAVRPLSRMNCWAQLCDFIGLIGTPEHCVRRIKELEAAGLDHLYLATEATYEFAHRELRAFKETIFPALAAAV